MVDLVKFKDEFHWEEYGKTVFTVMSYNGEKYSINNYTWKEMMENDDVILGGC